ncbi:extensin family protein [uncultured Phenylobacterium sp.]|uniref:extensin-like domain-containing protein n=1 Tax=uncultured Phenylobacterium sp. TaxID=349273 RepID=UPI0025CF49D6|nr:extensin family protein [uncultured Phenylobacterium sp.]
MPIRMRLKAASPQTLALAGLGALLLDLAIAALLVGTAVARWAPPEDLPWTPLRLAEPVGMATRAKFERAAADPAACRAILREGEVTFAEAPRPTRTCPTPDSLRLGRGVLALSPAAPLMTCREALAYAFWTRHAVQPAARAELRQPIVRVEHYGTYACRNIYGQAEGRRSEHAHANALDVAAFRTAGGARIAVVSHFRDEGPQGRFLRRVRDGACPWFRAVLSPDYNAAHRDHLHLDRGPYRVCR